MADLDPLLPPPEPAAPALPRMVWGTAHRRRLREVWRSAGWPYLDPLEAELLAAGLLARERDAAGRDTVHVTDAGIALMADTLQRNRASRDPHEALVARVVREMQHAGRLAWRGLTLRARVGEAPVLPVVGRARAARVPWATPLTAQAQAQAQAQPLWLPEPGTAPATAGPLPVPPAAPPTPAGSAEPAEAPEGQWVLAMPDVYSIRQTTVEAYLAPVAHEVKVRRADLLADLRRPAKGEAYRWLAGECWYVIREGIAQPDEIPEAYGVLVAPPTGPLVVARPAPQRAMRLPFPVWMVLARATPEPPDEGGQQPLGGLAGAHDANTAGGQAPSC